MPGMPHAIRSLSSGGMPGMPWNAIGMPEMMRQKAALLQAALIGT